MERLSRWERRHSTSAEGRGKVRGPVWTGLTDIREGGIDLVTCKRGQVSSQMLGPSLGKKGVKRS